MDKSFLKKVMMPILPELKPEQLFRALSNAVAASRWLGAEPHLIYSDHAESVERHLLELGVGKAQISAMIHRSSGDLFQDTLDSVRHHEIDLMMFSMDSIPIDESYAKAWQGLLLQLADIPVLICPVSIDLAQTPIRSLLVPMSGEPKISASLEVALSLANDVNVPVDLLHITEMECQAEASAPALGTLGEQFYHEYPKLIDQLIAQGSPYSGVRDKLAIREFCHCSGDIAQEVVKHVEEKPSPLLILEWKGSLASGRARTIKSAMARRSFPILLVREAPKQRSVLKVGNHFDAA